MTTFIFIATLVVGAQMGFLLGMVLMQKRVDGLRKQLDLAMKGWQESIELLQKVRDSLDGVLPKKEKDGSMVSPIQIKKD